MWKMFEILVPTITLYQYNKKVRQNIDKNNNSNYPSNTVSLCDVTVEILQDLYGETIQTKEKLENKATTNVIGVTVAVTLIMGASSLMHDVIAKYGTDKLFWIICFLFICAVIYMLAAGIHAIHMLTDENVVYKAAVGLDQQNTKVELDKKIALNRAQNIIRNNYIFTSYICIRNSLICLFAVMVLAIVPIPNFQQQVKSTEEIFFASNAIHSINQGVNKNYVIDLIKEHDKNGDYSVVDENHLLFLKFTVKDNIIIVHLIEPIVKP